MYLWYRIIQGRQNWSSVSSHGQTTFWAFSPLPNLVQLPSCAHIDDTSVTKLCRLRLKSWQNQQRWMLMVLTMDMDYGPHQPCSMTKTADLVQPRNHSVLSPDPFLHERVGLGTRLKLSSSKLTRHFRCIQGVSGSIQ